MNKASARTLTGHAHLHYQDVFFVVFSSHSSSRRKLFKNCSFAVRFLERWVAFSIRFLAAFSSRFSGHDSVDGQHVGAFSVRFLLALSMRFLQLGGAFSIRFLTVFCTFSRPRKLFKNYPACPPRKLFKNCQDVFSAH